MMVTSMQGVVKRYGSNIVLDYVDLDIDEGEIIGLLGPNAGPHPACNILLATKT